MQECLRIGKIRSFDRISCKKGLATFRGARKPKILQGVELALHPLRRDAPLLSTSCLCATRAGRKPCSEGTGRGTATSPAQKLAPHQSPKSPFPCKAHRMCSKGRNHPKPCSTFSKLNGKGSNEFCSIFIIIFKGLQPWQRCVGSSKARQWDWRRSQLASKELCAWTTMGQGQHSAIPIWWEPYQETAPSCTAEKPTKGLETPLLSTTHMHTQTHAFQK